jgi:hypothetical protein
MSAKPMQLIDVEARVLGVLVEKAFTTPEQYPLSLNAATVGSNQKSNRDPVTRYQEAEVLVALDGLVQKGLAGRVRQAASRVEKFRHSAQGALDLGDAELAVLVELLLRGPQSPGELRGRVRRMVPIETLEELAALLERLRGRGLVERLAPSPGTRAERYVQLLAPGLHPVDAASAPAESATRGAERASAPAAPRPSVEGRVEALERRVDDLSSKLDALVAELGT